MIYHPEDFMEILKSARSKWGDRVRAMIISRSQAIRIGLMIDEHYGERLIFVPGELPTMAESYAHKAECKHKVRNDKITISDVAPFSKLAGIPLFFRDLDMPPTIMIQGEDLVTWLDEADERWDRVDG